MQFDEKAIGHPVATAFDILHQPDIQLIHASKAASTKLTKSRKMGGLPIKGRPDVGLPPVKPDMGAQALIEASYKGGKKPALVLRFHASSTTFRCSLGEARISIHYLGKGEWKAFLQKKTLRWSRKKKDFTTGWRQLLSGTPAESAHHALHTLAKREGWFYHEGEWRSLAWVYKSVITVGLERTNGLPKSYEMGVKSGANLHVPGYWKWEVDSVPEVIRPVIVLPDNTGLSRTPVNPDMRSEEGYISHHEASEMPKGSMLGGKRVVRYPYRKRFTQKDPNPRKPPFDEENYTRPGLKAWLAQE